MTDNERFTLDVLRFLCEQDKSPGGLFWDIGDDGGFHMHVNCNDLFAWATADWEEVTPENFAAFKQAFADCEAANGLHIYADSLFACRVRGCRPQDGAYPNPKHSKALWPLFDACGPKRENDVINPRRADGETMAD